MRATTRKTLTPLATAKMQAAMSTLPQSLDDLVELTGLAKATVTRYVNELHAAGVIHVASWQRDGRGYPTIRQFKIGTTPDVDVPRTTRTAADRMRVLRADRKVGLR